MNAPQSASHWHVVVIGERPGKDANNRYLAVPEANVAVVRNTLASVPPTAYAGLYHQNAPFGIDLITEEFARLNCLRQFQFPTYWQEWDFNARQFVTDKYAGAKASRQMMRAAKDAIYDKNTSNNIKPDHGAILIAFGNPESDEIKAAVDYLGRLKNNPVQVRYVPLPVPMNPTVQVQSTPVTAGNPAPNGYVFS